MSVYRVWSPEFNGELGGFWTLEKPHGSLQVRVDAALDFDWSWRTDAGKQSLKHNFTQGTRWVEIEVPAGTHIFVGEAGYQRGPWVGGRNQVMFAPEFRVPKEWIKKGGRLK